MRGSLIEVMHSNFIPHGSGQGPARTRGGVRHALKPALLPVVSLMGPLAISSITSALVTETVFSLPGIGKLIVNGAGNRDYTLVLGLVVLITVLTVTLAVYWWTCPARLAGPQDPLPVTPRVAPHSARSKGTSAATSTVR